ncbi:hypothetical protein N9F08_00375 [bacterium]|nr:hypothetical protein [bacterium]
MKRIRIISSVLSLIALSLCTWFIFELSQEGNDLITASLNLVYFFTLLISLGCFRISLGYSRLINPVVTILSIAIISLSTYTWINSTELLITGKITLGLVPLMIGTTLMLVVKSNSKWSKITQGLFGIISISLATCVFLNVNTSVIYYALFIGLSISTLSVLSYLVFGKTS